ncbi:MAG TPA: malto-oligosyltrehalose trehalohydrolase [Rubrobacteraceae bacterium]|nr:malto-oligosyltrehalose trehalohydrolase [Rubrobacteraceae bacterium]
MRRSHKLPFGAEYLGEGETRFTLWAPAAKRVELSLEDGERVAMRRGEDGVFAVTAAAEPGARYRYLVDDEQGVPDPASRYQPEDVHGPSQVVDLEAFEWRDEDWKGRPWEETVLYELHVGSFSPEGTFGEVKDKLDHLVELGVTAVELMPLADFPGGCNWGYDGVLPYAPDSSYGTPEDLKELVQAAHEKGLMVFLDVVYNHFGPEGNYLNVYAPQFFTERHATPWGAAINFDGDESRQVREYFIHNALYWIEEYHIDGLRLDAVHAIVDESEKHVLEELAERVQGGPGRDRHVHLVLENEANAARYMRDGLYRAQWNDDFHNALHVALTGETSGYYGGYADAPMRLLARCLAEGFAYQGEPSQYRDGEKRGESSADLPATSFVSFLQNHDQVGNRAFGERITRLAQPEAVRAAAAMYLLSPQIPMLFMGEEWAAEEPFLFFCDFEEDLAPLVTEGRREEFAKFPEFSDPETRERIPDPSERETFEMSVLDWDDAKEHRSWLELYKELLRLRREEIVPRLEGISGGRAECHLVGDRGLRARWTLGDGSVLTLLANLGDEPLDGFDDAPGRLLYATREVKREGRELPAWSVAWYLEEND